jgi:UrcA family protein
MKVQFASFIASIALLATPALAQDTVRSYDNGPIITAHETQPANQDVISYSDLDLSTRSGAQVLIDRIREAASSVCRKSGVDVSKPIWISFYRSCVKKTADRAVANINRPIVNALYDEQFQQMTAGK